MSAPSPAGPLTFEQFAALDLRGRRLHAREGGEHARGAVLRTDIEGDAIVIEVGDVSREEDEGWVAGKDFDYRGARSTTSIFCHADGRLAIEIMYIGQIVILPEARP